MLGKARFEHIERSASEAIRNLRNAEELEDYRSQLLALDEQIDELVMQLGTQSSPGKAPDYTTLDKAKAERLLIARKKRIQVLEAAFAKQQKAEELPA